jgi:hypothetical protein
MNNYNTTTPCNPRMELIPKTNPLYFIDALYLTLKLAPWDLPNHACRAMQYQFQNDSNTKPAAPKSSLNRLRNSQYRLRKANKI